MLDSLGSVEARICDVAFVESMATLVVKFLSGRVYAVPLTDLEGVDPTGVTGVSQGSDGYSAVIEQESGNRLEVPGTWYYTTPSPDTPSISTAVLGTTVPPIAGGSANESVSNAPSGSGRSPN